MFGICRAGSVAKRRPSELQLAEADVPRREHMGSQVCSNRLTKAERRIHLDGRCLPNGNAFLR